MLYNTPKSSLCPVQHAVSIEISTEQKYLNYNEDRRMLLRIQNRKLSELVLAALKEKNCNLIS